MLLLECLCWGIGVTMAFVVLNHLYWTYGPGRHSRQQEEELDRQHVDAIVQKFDARRGAGVTA
jgi:hypothetical protein